MPDADPLRSYNFKVIIQGVTEGHFTQCSGLGVRLGVTRYREGGGGPGQVARAIPGQVEYADLELRYGLTSSRELWDWLMAAVSGQVVKKNVSVLMLDPQGSTELMRWDLVNAWPSQWRGSVLDAMSQEVAIESLILVFDTLSRT